jgi:hypothetical protein
MADRATRGQRRTADWGQAVEEILGETEDRPPPSLPRARGRRTTPHEQGRRGRKVTVTLPGDEWAEAIRELAGQFGLRTSDFVVWCISQAVYLVEAEGVSPQGSVEERAGVAEGVRLPWEP